MGGGFIGARADQLSIVLEALCIYLFSMRRYRKMHVANHVLFVVICEVYVIELFCLEWLLNAFEDGFHMRSYKVVLIFPYIDIYGNSNTTIYRFLVTYYIL